MSKVLPKNITCSPFSSYDPNQSR